MWPATCTGVHSAATCSRSRGSTTVSPCGQAVIIARGHATLTHAPFFMSDSTGYLRLWVWNTVESLGNRGVRAHFSPFIRMSTLVHTVRLILPPPALSSSALRHSSLPVLPASGSPLPSMPWLWADNHPQAYSFPWLIESMDPSCQRHPCVPPRPLSAPFPLL